MYTCSYSNHEQWTPAAISITKDDIGSACVFSLWKPSGVFLFKLVYIRINVNVNDCDNLNYYFIYLCFIRTYRNKYHVLFCYVYRTVCPNLAPRPSTAGWMWGWYRTFISGFDTSLGGTSLLSFLYVVCLLCECALYSMYVVYY